MRSPGSGTSPGLGGGGLWASAADVFGNLHPVREMPGFQAAGEVGAVAVPSFSIPQGKAVDPWPGRGSKRPPQDGRARPSIGVLGRGREASGLRRGKWAERLGVRMRGAPPPPPSLREWRDQLRFVPSCRNFGFVSISRVDGSTGGAWRCGLEQTSSLTAALWLTSPECLASIPYLFCASVSSAGRRGKGLYPQGMLL